MLNALSSGNQHDILHFRRGIFVDGLLAFFHQAGGSHALLSSWFFLQSRADRLNAGGMLDCLIEVLLKERGANPEPQSQESGQP